MRILLAVLTLTLIITASCKKEFTPGTIDYLTDADWKFMQIGFDGDKDMDIETSDFPHCLLDNEVEFYKDGSGLEDENTQSCPVFDPRYTAFEWTLSGNQKKINIMGDSTLTIGGEFNILLLNNTHLILQKDSINPYNQQSEWYLYKLVQDYQ